MGLVWDRILLLVLCLTFFGHNFKLERPIDRGFECEVCSDVAALVLRAVKYKIPEEIVVKGLREYCVLHKGGLGYACRGEHQCHELCRIVDVFAPVVFSVARQLEDDIDEKYICSLLGFCPNQSAFAPVFIALNSSAHFSPPPPPTFTQPALRIAHLTDVHINLEYAIGSSTDCGLPVCCYAYPYGSGTSTDPAGGPAGRYGDPACDSNMGVLRAFARDVHAVHAERPIHALFFTGDIPPHNVWNQTQAWNTRQIVAVSRALRELLPEGITVFPVIGNHASAPVNQLNVTDTQDPREMELLYRPLASLWHSIGWLSDYNVHTFLTTGGAYFRQIGAVAPSHPVWAFVFNSVLFARMNLFLVPHAASRVDPGGQFAFLRATLEAARVRGATVYILSHHPLSYWHPNHLLTFRSLVSNYSDVVAAHICGHTHYDETHVIWAPCELPSNCSFRPVAMSYNAGCLEGFGGHNPTWRIYTVAPRVCPSNVPAPPVAISDWTQRTSDLVPYWIHRVSDGPLTFAAAYTPLHAYHMPNLLPQSWLDLARRMWHDGLAGDFRLFLSFFRNFATNDTIHNPHPDLNETVVRAWICSNLVVEVTTSGNSTICDHILS